jgi:hypothetical protein
MGPDRRVDKLPAQSEMAGVGRWAYKSRSSEQSGPLRGVRWRVARLAG